MVAFIDEHRDEHGIEPICEQLQIAPSTYHAHKARLRDPSRRSVRAQRDEQLQAKIAAVWRSNFEVYGHRKVWRQLRRDGEQVARCTVQRLMVQMGLHGAVRGRAFTRTTIAETGDQRPADLVERSFGVEAPNRLWVSDITYVATWRGQAALGVRSLMAHRGPRAGPHGDGA